MRNATQPGFLIVAIFSAIFLNCNSETSKEPQASIDLEQTTQPFSPENIPLQTARINTDTDTTIKGEAGTIFRIYKNSFLNTNGQPVQGTIELSLKEVYNAADIAMGGLTTTSNGKILQTAGMIFIDASANGQPLKLGTGKYIGIVSPKTILNPNMQIFEGRMDNGRINWLSPRDILNKQLAARKVENKTVATPDSSLVASAKTKGSSIDAVVDYLYGDTSLPNDRKSVPRKRKKQSFKKVYEEAFLTELIANESPGFSSTDPTTQYVFSTRNLGWVNIDVFLSDPRTTLVKLSLNIENGKDFNLVHTSLFFSKEKVFISGYQTQDNSYAFSQSEDSALELPIGAEAKIFATARKDGKTYFALTTIKISTEQNISLRMQVVGQVELKKKLESL